MILSAAEVLALRGELDHSPDCAAAEMVTVTVDTATQMLWADSECTVPYVEAKCNCGFDDVLASGRAKLSGLAQ